MTGSPYTGMLMNKNLMLLFILCLAMAGPVHPQAAFAADIEVRSMVLPAAEHPVSAELFLAPGNSPRSAVILLHGAHGIDRFKDHYRHYGTTLAEAGFDAYLITYYSENDLRMRKQAQDAKSLQTESDKRTRAWAALVSDVAGDILADKRSSGKIGILGFSRGGFLATAAGGRDKRISAIAVFYGGIPKVLRGEITHLPPLLELHGDADTNVPLSEGKELVDLARRLGDRAEMVVYPGAGHGFKGQDAADAERRMVAFFQRELNTSR